VHSSTGIYTATNLTGQLVQIAEDGAVKPALNVALDPERGDQTFTLQAGSKQAQVDQRGLTINSTQQDVRILLYNPNSDSSTTPNVIQCTSDCASAWGSLSVQRMTATSSPISCAMPPLVQFSFCLLTSSSNPPSLSQPQNLVTLTSGILTVNSIIAPTSGSYTVVNVTQGIFSTISKGAVSSSTPAWLAPPGGFDGNDNVITFVPGSAEVQVDSSGLNIVTSDNTLNDYGTAADYVDCTDENCGTYGALYVKLYTGAASQRVACSPVAPVSSSSAPRVSSLTSSSSKNKK
jgi:hypothetical protein